MRMSRTLNAAAAVLLMSGAALAANAQQRPGGPPGGGNFPGAQQGAGRGGADSNGVAPVQKVSVTHHTVNVGGTQIAYTAHAGTLVLRDDNGKPNASVFFIAYTRDGQDATKRPLTFFFNGGPGSASIWLNMGIMSPRAPLMAPGGTQPAPPYTLADNQNTPLDVTDLVQVDAMMTGYSRPAPGVSPSQFTGDRNDIRMFAQFIRNYLDEYNRWSSPKYLFGESYGTFRSAGLASELQSNEGIELNGIMLLGTVLDFQMIQPGTTNDIGFASYFPSYTATAWFHKKLPPDMQKQSLAQVVEQSRKYAFGDYLTTLARGNTLSDAERSAAAQKIASLTGVTDKFVGQTNLRIDPSTFRSELMRNERLTLGRYDSRMIGMNGNATSTRPDYDPSDVAPTGAFMSGFMRYLHEDLDYRSTLQYAMSGATGNWQYSSAGRGYPTEMEALRSAMAKDPYLHVMVGAGYYDLATPFGGAEFMFSHLGYDKTYSDRVQFKYYESGHMAYLNQDSAKQLKKDIASFINATKSPTSGEY